MNYEDKWAYRIERVNRRGEAFLDVLLACAIGVGFGLALVKWWAA